MVKVREIRARLMMMNKDFRQFLNSKQTQLWHFIYQKEKLDKKLNTKSLSVVFHKTCLQENLLPRYTFYIIYINWMTVVKGDPKGSFTIATILRYRGKCYSFLWIAQLTLDPYHIMLSVKQGGSKYCFLSLWYDSTWD